MSEKYIFVKGKMVDVSNDHCLDLSDQNLYDTDLTQIGLETLINIQYLDLSDNHLRDLTALQEFTNLAGLKTLDLSFNEIYPCILKDLAQLSQLELLDLAYNDIYSIEEADALSSLRMLYLDGNPISFAKKFSYYTLGETKRAWFK